jgi:hypothetical protein
MPVDDAIGHRRERQQVDPPVRHLIAFEKSDRQTRRDEVPELAINTTAVRTDAKDFLYPRVRHLSLKEQSGTEGIEETADGRSRDIRPEILPDRRVSKTRVMVARDNHLEGRRDGERAMGDVIAGVDPEVLQCSVIRAIVPLLRGPHAHHPVRQRPFISRSEIRERGAYRDAISQAELGLHHDCVCLSGIVAAFAGHEIAVQVEMPPRLEVLIRDGDIAVARWRKKRLTGRGTDGTPDKDGNCRGDAEEAGRLRRRHGRRAFARSRFSFKSMALSTAAQ